VKERLIIFIYRAPYLQELNYVVNYTNRQIDNGKPVMVRCSGGKGRTETILAAYLIKKRNVLNAYQAIKNLRKTRGESIQSKDQRIFFSATIIGERPSTENNTNIK
jgi:atypical dual specificity phosphatase